MTTTPRRAVTRIRERASDGAYLTGWTLLRRLPAPVATRLSRTVADAAWKRRGAGVLRLEANLRRVRPELSAARLAALSRAGMRSYTRYWIEMFRLPALGPDQLYRSLTVDGWERLEAALGEGRGCVLALPHMANWDLAGAWIAAYGHPFTTVMERLRPESLFDRFVAYRQSLGMEVLSTSDGTRRAFGTLAKRLRDGGLVCLVAERDLSSQGVRVRFFGEETRMPPGPATLAQQTGAALLPVTLNYQGTVLHATVHPRIEVPEQGSRRERTFEMTQSLADVFAAEIAQHPQDWHMLQPLWLADLEPRDTAATRHAVGDDTANARGTPG